MELGPARPLIQRVVWQWTLQLLALLTYPPHSDLWSLDEKGGGQSDEQEDLLGLRDPRLGLQEALEACCSVLRGQFFELLGSSIAQLGDAAAGKMDELQQINLTWELLPQRQSGGEWRQCCSCCTPP